jgi:hypothetical protein
MDELRFLPEWREDRCDRLRSGQKILEDTLPVGERGSLGRRIVRQCSQASGHRVERRPGRADLVVDTSRQLVGRPREFVEAGAIALKEQQAPDSSDGSRCRGRRRGGGLRRRATGLELRHGVL